MLDSLLALLMAEPVKAVLGSGGLLGAVVLIVRWWNTRPNVVVKRVSETFDTKNEPLIEVTVVVELENHGREATSVRPEVRMRCFQLKRTRYAHSFLIQEADRTLPPVTPKTFTLKGTLPAPYVFSHFRVFKFSPSRGGGAKLRVLNASGQTTGALRFTALEWLFRLSGALPHVRG